MYGGSHALARKRATANCSLRIFILYEFLFGQFNLMMKCSTIVAKFTVLANYNAFEI